VANQKEFFEECFKGDKTFPLIILLAKWVYQLVYYYKEMGVHVLDAVIRDWLEDHPSTLSLEGPRRRAMNRVLVWNRGLKVSWSTSNNKATATQTPSKVFFPAAF